MLNNEVQPVLRGGRHSGWLNWCASKPRLQPVGKLFAATSVVVLVLCILGVGQRLRLQIRQQADFLESELILSVHDFNQLQREVNRLHEQMVMSDELVTQESIKFHQNLVQSRIKIIQKHLISETRSKGLGPELSAKLENIIQEWEVINLGVNDLYGDISNSSLKYKNSRDISSLELRINRFTQLNQSRNRNRYRELLSAQRDSLNWLLILLAVFLLLAFVFTIYTARFVHARQKMLEKVRQLSSTDELTQIPNRRQFNEALSREWRRAIREGLPFSIILCDIDYFKRYNDYYGHQAGDDCLWRVAQALQQGLWRAGDFVARYGGEEFVIILPNTAMDSALTVASRLRDYILRMALEHHNSDVSPFVTLSMGVASGLPMAAITPELALNYADQALYAAKEQGRDRACVKPFSPEQQDCII